MLITDSGQTIRIAVGEIRETGRNAQGVRLMSVEEDERVVGVELIGEVVTAEDGGAERRSRGRSRRRPGRRRRSVGGQRPWRGAGRKRRSAPRRWRPGKLSAKPKPKAAPAKKRPAKVAARGAARGRCGSGVCAPAPPSPRRPLRARPPGSVPVVGGHGALGPDHGRGGEPPDTGAVSALPDSGSAGERRARAGGSHAEQDRHVPAEDEEHHRAVQGPDRAPRR